MDSKESHQLLVLMKTTPGEDISVLPRGWLEGSCLDTDARVSLVDWLVQVQQYLGLTDTCLHAAVTNLDIALSKVDWDDTEVQLLGLAAIQLCAKLEEDTPPSCDLLLPLCGGVYTKEDLTRMEVELLQALEWRVRSARAVSFLYFYSDIAGKGRRAVFRLARAILDLTLTQEWYNCEQPSKLASSCFAAASCLLGHSWGRDMIHLTGFGLGKLDSLIKLCFETISHSGAEGIGEKHSKALKSLAKTGDISSVLLEGLESYVRVRRESTCG